MKVKSQSCAGFSLVEVVVALGVASLSLLPILGLLPVGLSSSKNSTTQTGAMNLITAIAADMRTATSTVTSSPRYAIDTTSTGAQTFYFDDAGAATTLTSGKARYKATIQMITFSTTKTVSRISITWPPQAATANVLGSVDVVVPLSKN